MTNEFHCQKIQPPELTKDRQQHCRSYFNWENCIFSNLHLIQGNYLFGVVEEGNRDKL